MSTVMEMGLELLRRRRIAFVEQFYPYYLCSMGCHIFNRVNHDKKIFWESGRIPNMRLHIMKITPPGYGKSFDLEQMLDGQFALLDSTVVEPHFIAEITGAGFLGTVQIGEGGTQVKKVGLAEKHKNSILGCGEFSAVTDMMKVGHSTGLGVALLEVLESGWGRKWLAAGEIQFRSNCTLWAATRPMHLDLTSGMARRLFFIQFIPTRREQYILKQSRRNGKDVKFEGRPASAFKRKVNALAEKIEDLEEINFERALYVLFDNLRIPHHTEMLYERLALGYTLVNDSFGKELYVRLTPELETMIKRGHSWRSQILRGSREAQILVTIRDHGGSMGVTELLKLMLDFGMTWYESSQITNKLVMQKLVKRNGGEIRLA